MHQLPTKFEVHFHLQHYSAGWTWLFTFWPRTWSTLLHVRWANFPPILVFLGRFILDLSAKTCVRRVTWPCDVDLWPWRSRRLSLIHVFVFHLCTTFEVRRPSRSEVDALPVSALVGVMTLTFDLETGAHYCRGVDNLSTNFGISRTFHFRLIGQHCQTRHVTLRPWPLSLGSHSACRWCGASCSVCIPSLKFVGLPVRKILNIYTVWALVGLVILTFDLLT